MLKIVKKTTIYFKNKKQNRLGKYSINSANIIQMLKKC